MLPGGGVRAVTGKVVVDQLVAAPLTISAFYIGAFFNKSFKTFFCLFLITLCVLQHIFSLSSLKTHLIRASLDIEIPNIFQRRFLLVICYVIL